jgi:hypothetical protein
MTFMLQKVIGQLWSTPQSTQSNMQMGGSSRPISATIHNYSDSIVHFYVQYGYTSINNQNYSYFSELKFKKIESW